MHMLTSPRGKLLGALALLTVLGLSAALRDAGAAQVARGLLAVGAALLVGAWLWRGRGGAARARFALPQRLQVHARTGLSQRCGLALVEADGQRFLVAYGDGFAEIRAAAPTRAPARRKSSRASRRPVEQTAGAR
jgi:flagellar protein FliO/FliZ